MKINSEDRSVLITYARHLIGACERGDKEKILSMIDLIANFLKEDQ